MKTTIDIPEKALAEAMRFTGAKTKREEAIFRQVTELCLSLEMDDKVWRAAAALGRVAKKGGVNCRLADILIVACAQRHGAALMHRDKHLQALLELEK